MEVQKSLSRSDTGCIVWLGKSRDQSQDAYERLDVDERVFRNSLTQSIVTLFGRLEKRGQVRCEGMRNGVKLWTLCAA